MKKRQQTEIDLWDLLKEFFYHWRSVLACMLVFAVLACGYCGVKNASTNKALQQAGAEAGTDTEMADEEMNIGDGSLMDVLAERGGLSELEISNVKTAISIYAILQEYYDDIDDAYAQIGLANEKRSVLQYAVRVSGSVTGTDAADTLVYAISQYVNNGGLSSAIAGGGDTELTVDELNNRIKVSCLSNDSDKNNVKIVDGAKDIVPFTIICLGTNQNENEKLCESVKTALDSFVQNYDELGNLELMLLGEYAGEKKDTSVLMDKSDDTSAIVSQFNQFNNFVTNFTDVQKAVFNEVVGSDVLAVSDESVKTTLAADTNGKADVSQISITAGMKKYLVLGLAMGLILSVLCYGMYYVFTDTVKTKEEFERAYGLYGVGNLVNAEKRNSFDRLLQKIFGDKYDSLENRRELTVANIRALCVKNDCNRISIVSTIRKDASMQENITYIQTELSKDGIDAAFVGNVIESVAGFDKMVEMGTIVLLEKTKETKYTEMNQIASICEEHKIDVLGVVCQ